MTKLGAYRKANGLTLVQLAAAAAPISVPYLCQIENGQRRPSPDVARRIENACNGAVTAMDLLFPEPAEADTVETGA